MKLNATPRLHAVMKAKRWTQARLAEASGVTQGSISRFDKNSRHEDWHVFSIAKTLGVKVEELFEIEEATKEDAK
ncbi:transcriptional regulator [Bacillus subtilis subsp. subtilis]|uniref:helix-turn-helix domain-containing protein n=1 Tax=Bacillus subtilis TaxID=1423 RepID=UPI000A32B2D7|nr:helix-turn-helix transcriptional regulator [Bacillus subtilis]OTQ88932.1 transcriptional regulator [Bacillus subtilis subsp. subtilis]